MNIRKNFHHLGYRTPGWFRQKVRLHSNSLKTKAGLRLEKLHRKITKFSNR